LSDQLFDQPWQFDFFQAVRLLERLAEEQAVGEPGPVRPVRRDHAPRREVVRFRAAASHVFPGSAVQNIYRRDTDVDGKGEPGRPELTAGFMGMIGPQGVLPQHYTALVIERLRLKDHALRDFLDIFHHRIISLFYRAWEKYRFPLGYERAARGGDEDLFTRCLYSLVGMGTAGLRGRTEFDDETLLFFAGHFAHYPRSAVALECLLNDYLELSAGVLQLQGQWLMLSPDDQTALPSAARPQGLNVRLGSEVVIGERVWDVESKFRVRLGPLNYAEFRRFIPNGDRLRPLCQLVRTYCGPQFDFDVQPVLKAPEVPECRLGSDGPTPALLGWNTWVWSRPFDHDVSDAAFFLEG
jgi:type VI secretion system protein ImpH